ncbi:MAG TPA: sigma-70 family RNA polymerase sigma factor [Pirellulaceae bacterium]|nr:sigma-70 family RNA polymerase sigma factor [Pirellulaceae bacterium]
MSQDSLHNAPHGGLQGQALAEWIQRARDGDPSALGELIHQFRDYLMLIANEDLGSELQGKFGASDFVQETMLIAHQKFAQFRGQTLEELKGWLRQILRNDLHRARRQYCDTQRRQIHRERTLHDGQAADVTDGQYTPGTDAVVREEGQLLRQAMAQLPENYRQAIQWREWEDLSYAEIGRRLGISEEAARKYCSRGLDKLEWLLKSTLAESREDAPCPNEPHDEQSK